MLSTFTVLFLNGCAGRVPSELLLMFNHSEGFKYIDQLKNSSHYVLGFDNSMPIADWSVEYMYEP